MTPDPNPLLTRMSAWTAQHRWAGEGLIIAIIIGFGSLRAPDEPDEIGTWLCTVGLTFPLLLRRQYPVEVFLGIAAMSLALWALDIQAFGFSALLVALYTVAVAQTLRTTLAAAALLEVGIVLASVRWAPHGHPEDALVALTGLAVAAGVLGINAQHRQTLLASLRDRAARLEAERDQEGRIAAGAERARIAREMHDIVAHNLSVMIALTDGATYAMQESPAEAELATRTASRTGREALNEMRRLLGVLRDDASGADRTPQPGIDQIDALVEQVRAAGIPTKVKVTGTPPAPGPGGFQLAVFRIVQEALTNALKHGGAGAEAAVDLHWDGPGLRVEIGNTGPLAAAPGPDNPGSGLRGMRERAAVYQGHVDAGPAVAGGWTVIATLRQPITELARTETPA